MKRNVKAVLIAVMVGAALAAFVALVAAHYLNGAIS